MKDTRTETEKQLYDLAVRCRPDGESSFDLFQAVLRLCAPPKPLKAEGWINQYDGVEPTFHWFKENADDYARRLESCSCPRIACIYVCGEEGKGPDGFKERDNGRP